MGREFFEGGSTSGPHPPAVVKLNVAPSFDGATKNTIRITQQPIACWRMNHALFAFDSSAVQPEIAGELPALESLVESNPDAPLSLFGHADPTGDDDYNKVLAGRRARAIYALLVRDVAIWEALFSDPIGGDRWGLRSTQMMLATLKDDAGDPYFADAPDGAFSQTTKAAIEHFQSDTPGLGVDGVAGPKTRKELYRKYMDAICLEPDRPFIVKKESFLGGGADPDGKAAYQGCGEFNPVFLPSKGDTKGPSRDALNAPNRRAMIFLFRPGTKATGWPCPAWNEGAAGCKSAFWPDGDTRRQSTDEAREYRVDLRTMACRFYDRFARVSPCEGRGRLNGPPGPNPVETEGDYPFSL